MSKRKSSRRVHKKTVLDVAAAESVSQDSRATMLSLEQELEKLRLGLNKILAAKRETKFDLRSGLVLPTRLGPPKSSRRAQSKADKGRNPIIEAVQLTLRGRRPTIIWDADDLPVGGTPELRNEILPLWPPETIIYIGILVIHSLMAGDRRIIKTVGDAIKQADHLFNRDREPVLLRQAFLYMTTGKDWQTPDELKKGIEKRFNCSNKLPQYKWNRIRKALRLPKVTGRPREKVRHETAKSVS
jgi:hypothetical protein